MFAKPLRLKSSKDHLSVLYGGVVLAKVNKKVLVSLLADLDLDSNFLEKKPKKKSKPKKVVKKQPPKDEDIIMKAKQLAKAYAGEKKTFYRSKAVKEISSKEKAFDYFIDAARIVEEHGVTYKKFLKAQIHGLNFVDGGKGMFPRPNQLGTEQAETRLLDYIRDSVADSSGGVVKVNLTQKERDTPLGKNMTYIGNVQKIKDGIATLKETVYVRELQQIRRGKVLAWVEKHLERLTN